MENQQLVESIQHLYTQINGIYGYSRMTINRQREREGLAKINKKRIYRLMQICELKAVIRRKPKRYRKSKPDYVKKKCISTQIYCGKTKSKMLYRCNGI
ncbi:IS3 family transposase [Lysinibacillus boronitolerans]|uniref:IS3 family transposase n=1 Tax=Lysinibacillus boronitolerans TaxID=309788 RepID=UPI000FFC4BE0|nr:IS3 family transposase [Lysinibacillus boronitolerans]